LIVVGDAALQAVPFGALTAPGARHPLVVDHEVVQEPSAASVDALRTALAGRKPKTGAVAVFADPVVGTDDPRLAHPDHDPPTHDSVAQVVLRGAEPGSGLQRLPETAEEAAAILALAPASSERARLGFAATKAAVQDPGLGDYRIVHFATHGLLDADHPELSGLVFSLFQPDGTGQDGYLRLTDVFNLSLPVDLAVLSACETGQGDLVGGEGVVGLTRGFFYAGAARLVVSLWKVDDAATKELMTQFYREMLGPAHLRPAAALRKAQLAMLDGRQWNHPFFWAPFIIQGEWR
jgi:CHAT domain-containing protein